VEVNMFSVEVSDPSQVAEARRRASGAATASGFDLVRTGQVALAATELSTNLIKHGKGGQLLVNADDDRLELLALDRGEGIADLAACLADGYSTAGTRGAGLGAVQRLAQEFEVAAWPGLGTAVLAIISRDATPGDTSAAPRGLVIAMPGEDVAGDAWSSYQDATGITVFVVDGLGHGTEAAMAANAAVNQFERSWQEPPAEIIAAVHRAMRHTRGGAVAVARLDWESATVTYAGLGNISGVVVGSSGPARRLVSHPGIAGHNARKIQAFEYPCPDGMLIMHSDGVATSWTLDRYPGLIKAHPLLVAGVLYRDFARGRDDTTIAVSRTGHP
jgi:anti-sigma regulatory factor (Ser/Thr protein kinase)